MRKRERRGGNNRERERDANTDIIPLTIYTCVYAVTIHRKYVTVYAKISSVI